MECGLPQRQRRDRIPALGNAQGAGPNRRRGLKARNKPGSNSAHPGPNFKNLAITPLQALGRAFIASSFADLLHHPLQKVPPCCLRPIRGAFVHL